MKKIIFSVSALFCLVIMYSCQSDDNIQIQEQIPQLPETAFKYSDFTFPAHFPEALVLQLEGGVHSGLVDDDVATLGRVLFYDKQLSLNNTISCGSCHKQTFAFADPVAGSVGFQGAVTPRNAMAIVNPILNNNFFWDSRVRSAEDLALEPVQNHIEMGMESLDKLAMKLERTSYYGDLFEQAFGTRAIHPEGLSTALAQFMRSMVSYESKFDKGMENDFADFTPLELAGKQLFFSEKAQCSSCHANGNFAAPDGAFFVTNIDTFSGDVIDPNDPFINDFPGGGNPYAQPQSRGTANIGLDVIYEDKGRSRGKFKIPSLRNIALTGPYMHDGRFGTLEEVVDHYSDNIQPHTDLDTKFRAPGGGVAQMGFTELEKRSLVAFMETLTDANFIKDEKFSDPFEN